MLAVITTLCLCSAIAPEPDALQDAQIARSLDGRWSGSLVYRDFASDKRVRVPASVACESFASAPMVAHRIRFDEPGGPVESLGLIILADGRYTDLDDAGAATYTIASRRFDSAADWRLVLLGEETDAGEPAAVRVTMTMDADALTQTREVRPLNAEASDTWSFRNGFELTRVAPDPDALLGQWSVDLRPTPEAEPYLVTLKIESVEEGRLTGTFYNGSAIRDGRIATAWGRVRLAFITEDGSGEYCTSATLEGDRLVGTTLSVGRGFLMEWRAERAE